MEIKFKNIDEVDTFKDKEVLSNSRTELDNYDFEAGEFWRKVAPYRNVSTEEFRDYRWQVKNTIYNRKRIIEFLSQVASKKFVEEVSQALDIVPMQVRITPYLLSLIDWCDPVNDPIRIQFIPLVSEILPDHPMLEMDSLAEEKFSPIPQLVHRYPDKVLFLPQSSCPVYCRYCTRSYSVGADTNSVSKSSSKWSRNAQEAVYKYLEDHPEVEDVVISGGDLYNISAKNMRDIALKILNIPSILRIRLATKGVSINPTRISAMDDWTKELIKISSEGRSLNKQVAVHTHFNHQREITQMTKEAMDILYRNGVIVRNQSVMIRGVNDSFEEQSALIKKLSAINIQPYYVYLHDMVKGLESLRTPLWKFIEIEEKVRGITAGFNTPTFVVDLPKGGGKRNAWSFRNYNRKTGVSTFKAPSISNGECYFYADPLHSLSPEIQKQWLKGTIEKKKNYETNTSVSSLHFER